MMPLRETGIMHALVFTDTYVQALHGPLVRTDTDRRAPCCLAWLVCRRLPCANFVYISKDLH